MDKINALNGLAALAHGTRLEVFRLLGVRQNTMSSHLAILNRAGLISKSRDGRVIRYGAHYGQMRELLLYLLEDCCGGNAEICAPVIEAARCAC